jgi:prophage regulatory protein
MPEPMESGLSTDDRPDTLLRLRDVMKQTSLSRATIYRLIALGAFPAPLKCGFSSRWSALEISAFIRVRKAARQPGGEG